MPSSPAALNRPRVIFVDWYGVMSTALIWVTAQDQAPTEGLAGLEDALDQVFSTDVVNQWMRGDLTTRQIITRFLVAENNTELVTFLERQATLD
jgi:hypothetical protein